MIGSNNPLHPYHVEYLPWCECGWMGYLMSDEATAAAVAYRHATGRDPMPEAPATRPKHLQTEVIFDPEPYVASRASAKERRVR